MAETPLPTSRRLHFMRSSGPRPGTIFSRTLRDNLPGIFAWGMGYSLLIAIVVFLYPALEANDMLSDVLGGLGLMEMFTEEYAVDARAIGTFPGYLAFQALGWGPLLLAIYLIPQGISAVLGEEAQGTLSLLLSTPTPRWRLILEKLLAIIASLMCILLLMWLSLLVSTSWVPEAEITLSQITTAILHICPISLVILTGTLLLSVALRNPRTVGGIMAMLVIISYFLRSMAEFSGVKALLTLRHVSIFNYYSSVLVMLDGPRVASDIGLLLVAGLLVWAAVWMFHKRDLYI